MPRLWARYSNRVPTSNVPLCADCPVDFRGGLFSRFASKSFGACASRRFTKARQLRKAEEFGGSRELVRQIGCTFEEVQNAVKHRGAAMGIPAQLQVH